MKKKAIKKMSDKKCKITAIINRAPIRQQLYLMYTAIIVVPVVLLGMFLLLYTYRMMVNYHTDLLESDNHRVRNILFEITTQIYNISENISFNQEIQEILTTGHAARQDDKEAAMQNSALDSYKKIYMEISAIEIYTDNPALVSNKQFHQADEEIMNTDWYQKAIAQSGIFWQEMTREDKNRNQYWNLCLVRKIPLINSPYHAVLVIRISDDYLRTRIDSSEYINMLSVGESTVFYSSDREKYGQALPCEIDYEEPYFRYTGRVDWDGKPCFVNISALDTYQSNPDIYVCTIDEQGYADIWSILYLCGMVLLVALIIPGIMLYVFANYFTEARAYETQIKEQELLIRQQEMEFKMLSSQINPHFLYNTLETIRMKAFTAGDKEAATAIKLLGKSMRYVLETTGTVFTTLKEALNHTDVYMQIQHLRFGERIQYEKKIEDGLDTAQYRILPLVLQPLIENAIVHGLEETEEGGRIVLSIARERMEKEELLIIDVEDNGCGMTKEELDRLHENIEIRNMSRSKSIGLYNINQRMKLCYGEAYHMHIYAEAGAGTRVRLTLPAQKNE